MLKDPNLAVSFIENTIIVQYDPLFQTVFDQAKKIRCYDYYQKSVTFKPLQGKIKSPYKKVTVKPVEIQKIEEETEDEDLVLDFSSGSAKVVENTATVIEELSEEESAKGQLIRKANSKLFIRTKKPQKYFCISALASKSG